MSKFNSISYKEGGFNLAILLIRLVFGINLAINHGFVKLIHFSDKASGFYDPFHIGSKWSLVLVIFAELFCSLFVVIGLFTRLAAVPVVICMAIAVFMAHAGSPFQELESGLGFLSVFLAILIVGPGRISIDGMIK